MHRPNWSGRSSGSSTSSGPVWSRVSVTSACPASGGAPSSCCWPSPWRWPCSSSRWPVRSPCSAASESSTEFQEGRFQIPVESWNCSHDLGPARLTGLRGPITAGVQEVAYVLAVGIRQPVGQSFELRGGDEAHAVGDLLDAGD